MQNLLFSRSAGKTNVAAAFSCDFISGSHLQSRSYSASISLSAVPDLPLALGVPITWVLPSHYTTSKLLPFVESLGQWDSQSHKGSITYSLLKHCGGKNEPITKDDISIDGNRIRTGESNNLACIQAKDRSTGRIEVASCVRVAEVILSQHLLVNDSKYNLADGNYDTNVFLGFKYVSTFSL